MAACLICPQGGRTKGEREGGRKGDSKVENPYNFENRVLLMKIVKGLGRRSVFRRDKVIYLVWATLSLKRCNVKGHRWDIGGVLMEHWGPR